MQAADSYRKGIRLADIGLRMGIDLYIDRQRNRIWRSGFCCFHQLQEIWDRKRALVEKVNFKLLEAGGGDPMNKCVQISANTQEPETVKIRECDRCHDRKLPLYVTVGNSVEKQDRKRLQLGHQSKPSENSIWVEVSGRVVHDKIECDETRGSCE